MQGLGLRPVPGSGAGWVHKEDGENDLLLAQLKSTDGDAIMVKAIDLEKLKYHAFIAHKLPIFVLQFIKNNRIYCIIEKDILQEVAKALTGKSEGGRGVPAFSGQVQDAPSPDPAGLPDAPTAEGRAAFDAERNRDRERRAQARRAKAREKQKEFRQLLKGLNSERIKSDGK